MYLSRETIQELKSHNFVKRGNAFFRVLGDGVLQVVKLEYQRTCGFHDLQIGLFSMYSNLEAQWFTAGGCIPRYSVQNIIGQNSGPLLLDPRNPHSQASSQEVVLIDDGLPWLDSIKTQRELVDGICYLETSWGGTINWVDSLKLFPFLLCGDYLSAQRVILSIQEQRKWGYACKKQYLSPMEYQHYLSKNSIIDSRFECLLKLVSNRDVERIRELASINYSENMQYAKFCMK